METEKIRNTNLIDLSSTYFDCFSQQLLLLTYFLKKEYWKCFLNQKITYNEENSNAISDYINVTSNIMDSMYKFYGIYFEKDNKFNVYKLNTIQDLYVINFSIYYYKPCSNIPSNNINDKHSFILYKKDKECIYIYDNFYRLSNYKMPINIFIKGCRDVYKVQTNSIKNNFESKELLEEYIINQLKFPKYKIFFELLRNMKKNNQIQIDSKFFIKLKEIYSMEYKQYLLIKKYQSINHDEFIKLLMEKSKSNAESWREIWYNLMKCYLKQNKISRNLLLNEIERMLDYSKIDYCIFREIILIKKNSRYSIKKLVIECVINYLKIDGIEDKKVKDYLNGITILEFCNYIEDKFGILLKVGEITSCIFFKEIIYKIYQNILESNYFVDYLISKKGGE